MVKPTLKPDDLVNKAIAQFQQKPSKRDMALYLRNIPYYAWIKGYNNSSLKNAERIFKEQITPDVLYQIHWFEMGLSNLLLKFSLETEKHIKSVLSEIVSTFGNDADSYLNDRLYSKRNTAVFSTIRQAIEKDENGVFEYAQNKFGLIPSWYTVQHITLGQTIGWYSRLLPASKTQYVKLFFSNQILFTQMKPQDRLEMLRVCMNYILEIRNKAAHGNNFLTTRIETNIQSRWMKDNGLINYFKLTDKGAIDSNFINYLAIIILLTDLPLFAINALTEFKNIIWVNAEEQNPISKSGFDSYKLLKIEPNDLNILGKLIEY